MDVIYTNGQLQDIGVLDCIELDYDAAGSKDFQLTMATEDAQLEEGAMWYVPGEEYCGVIESMSCSSEEDEVKYMGPNARGILSRRIINNKQITSVSGLFSDIAEEWIEQSGLSTLFTVETNSLEVDFYQLPVFPTVYDALVGALSSVNALLILEVQNNHTINIRAEMKRDLSEEIQYTGNSSYAFEIEKESNAYNHAISYAIESDGTVYSIDLFTDENGGIQPYATSDYPIEDTDYILNESMKLISGDHERTFAIENTVEIVENYKLTESLPEDWKYAYDNYYEQVIDEDKESISYIRVEGISNPIFSIMKKKPEDWDTGYTNYYTHNGSGMTVEDFQNVSPITEASYKKLEAKPDDWTKNWKVYYERVSDGIEYSFNAVTGVEYNSYKKMTIRPSDWSSNYSNYYRIGTAYIKNSSNFTKTPKWKKNTYYKKSGESYHLINSKPDNWNKTAWRSYYTAKASQYVKIGTKRKVPKFVKNKYYKLDKKSKAPTYVNNKYYYKYTEIKNPPAFQENYYWSKLDLLTAPVWTGGKYFEKVIDHYAALVEQAITQLREYSPSQTARMTLEDYEVRIGDTVGCYDAKSGISINEEVTNIVYKINGAEESYDYTIGGN